jgi:hypothetical protein
MNWIHLRMYELDPTEQGALLRMCHFDDVLDQSGIICTFLILCCLMGGNILIRKYQVMEIMWLFPFQILVWIFWF